MPMYEYQCAACGHQMEAIQKFSDKPLKSCPKCKKPRLEKLLSTSAIQFKGSGWYITDYARKSSSETAKPDRGDVSKETKSDSGGDSKDANPSSKDSGKEAAQPAAKTEPAKSTASTKK